MSAFSDYLENELLDHILRASAYSVPANVWIALYTTATTDADGGTEATGGSYARLKIGAGEGLDFIAASAGATTNNEEWAWATATASWGNVTHTSVRDAASAGNSLIHGPLTTPKPVDNGDTFKFAAGTFDISLD